MQYIPFTATVFYSIIKFVYKTDYERSFPCTKPRARNVFIPKRKKC